MRYLFLMTFFITAITTVNAQTPGASVRKKPQTAKQAPLQQQKGSGQFHGSRDTTPGSPMGTGGAGGDMSGSPAASAIETDDQTSKAQVQKDSVVSGETSATTKRVNAKRKTSHHKTPRNL